MQELAIQKQENQTQENQAQATQNQAMQMQATQKQAIQQQAMRKRTIRKDSMNKHAMPDCMSDHMPNRVSDHMPNRVSAGAVPVVFLGRRTLSKLYLMLHFGRMLSAAGFVRLDTVNPGVADEAVYDYCGIEIHEHPDPDNLRLVQRQTDAVFMASCRDQAFSGQDAGQVAGQVGPAGASPICWMLDLPDYVNNAACGQVYLVTDPDRNSLEEGFDAVRRTASWAPGVRVHRIYLDVCESSRIDVRYMETLFARNLSKDIVCGEWLAIAASERDQGAILDNQHDDRLRLSRLSPSYRRLLQELAALSHGLGGTASRKLLGMADRRK